MTQVSPRAGGTGRDGDTRPDHGLAHLVTCVRGTTAVLSEASGDIRPGGPQGLFVHDTRVLDRLEVLLDGERPSPLGASIDEHGGATFHAHVRRYDDPNGDPTVMLVRERVVDGSLRERLRVTNHGETRRSMSLEIGVGADFAHVSEVKRGGGQRSRPVGSSGEGLGIRDGDGPRHVEVLLDPPGRWDDGRWCVDLDLGPRGDTATVEIAVVAHDAQGTVRPPATVDRPHRDELPSARGSSASGSDGRPFRVASSDPDLDRLVRRSVADLRALELRDPDVPDDRSIAAGSPWYLALFGRDSIWTALMSLPTGTELALGTLRSLARRQGRAHDRETEEAPGRILHELRTGDLAERADLPPVYYGSVDATPLFVVLLSEAWRWGADPEEVRALIPHAEAALGWLATDGDPVGDGFTAYAPSGGGLSNQGWKDSEDGIRHRDGRVATPPIALVEVQGYAYDAAVRGAELLEWAGVGEPDRWRGWAAELRQRFRDRFWVDDGDGRYPALAIDGDGVPVDALSSDIGHLLSSGILDGAEAADVGRRLAESSMDSGWGLRTMSADAAAYQPMSYHRGSVWPHDTAIVAWGLARAGLAEPASSLIRGLVAAGPGFGYRLPELFGGFPRRGPGDAPVPHPAACRPQGWSAGAVLLLLRACLGLEPDLPRGRVTVAPLRPPPFPRLEVTGIAVGGGSIDVRIDPSRGVDVETHDLDVAIDLTHP